MTKSSIYFLLISLITAVTGYFLQTKMFLNGDVGSLLYDTKLFLAGGNYVSDFFETNPPMIFLLYTPIVFLTKWSLLNIMVVTRVYIILLALWSVGLCGYLLKQALEPKDNYLRWVLLYTLLFSYIFLPICEFGQREHLFVMLMMPYIFAAVLAAQQKKLPWFFAMVIGLMAGLCIGMKPYFLAPLVCIELYLMVKKRHLFGWVRTESIVCGLVLVAYLGWVIQWFPNYFDIMMPLISHLYYIGIKEPWTEFFSHLPVVFVIFTALHNLFYIHKIKKNRELLFVVQWALIGMIIAFCIPRAPWYYHLFPAITLACLFINVCFYEVFIDPAQFNLKNSVVSLLIAFAVPGFCFGLGTLYSVTLKKTTSLNQVVNFVNSLPTPPTIYCFSSNSTGDCFTLIYLTQSHYGGRYPFFWWIKGLRTLEKNAAPLPSVIQKDKTYLINVFAEDLNHFQPDYFIINNYSASNAKERFTNYFADNPQFNEAWRHYHYYKTFSSYEIYKRG